jgi:hypothetical protein
LTLYYYNYKITLQVWFKNRRAKLKKDSRDHQHRPSSSTSSPEIEVDLDIPLVQNKASSNNNTSPYCTLTPPGSDSNSPSPSSYQQLHQPNRAPLEMSSPANTDMNHLFAHPGLYTPTETVLPQIPHMYSHMYGHMQGQNLVKVEQPCISNGSEQSEADTSGYSSQYAGSTPPSPGTGDRSAALNMSSNEASPLSSSTGEQSLEDFE